MAIEAAAFLRRFALTGFLVLLLIVSLCVAAVAQAPTFPTVMSGSVSPVNHDQWGQIYKILVAKSGDVLFLDSQNGALYQLTPSGSFFTISAPGATLKGSGNFWNDGMAFDSQDTLYIADRYDSSVYFFRVPYDPVKKTWPLTADSSWGRGIVIPGTTNPMSNTYDIAFDDQDNMIVSRETPWDIWRIPIAHDAAGTPGTPQLVISGLKYRVPKIAVDHVGNIFFIEDPWDDRAKIAPGVLMIAAGSPSIVGHGTGDAESDPHVTRVDPGLSDWKGVTVDPQGNLYISDQNDAYGGGAGMIVMVPNENGVLNKNDAVVVAPVPASAAVALDPRGFMWIPVATGGWTPTGSLVTPGTLNFVKFAFGSASVGSSAVGTQGGGGEIFFTFNKEAVLGAIQLPQGFTKLDTDPNADPEAATPAVPCTVGKKYVQYDRCRIWAKINPAVVGGISGELKLLDSNNNVIDGSVTNIYGVGLGSGLSVLVPAAESAVGSGFKSPAQVATDSADNIYVADTAQGKVLKYPGATSVGTSLTAPTGVAVDGAGNVFIADSGKVIKVPVQGAQSDVLTGLGANLNLAVDGMGNVYVADPDNSKVLQITNRATASVLPKTISRGTGLSHPSAVASDIAGNLVIADGTKLISVQTSGVQTGITNALDSTTGLALDASGAVYAAQSSGVIRIPVMDGWLSFNDKSTIGSSSSAIGVALDPSGNVYTSTTTGVTQLSVNGSVYFNDFGPVIPYVESDAQAQIINIGNRPLNLSPLSGFQFSGDNAADFGIVAPSDAPACDSANPVSAGAFCYLGVSLTAGAEGARTGAVGVQSDAKNVPSISLALSGNAVPDPRPATTMNVVISPEHPVYPANVTVTVSVAASTGTAIPDGSVSLSISGQKKQTADLVNGVASFSYQALQGGVYNLKAIYGGSGDAFAVSAKSSQFTVYTAPSTIAWTPDPSKADEWPYIGLKLSHEMTVSVSSAVGTPTGKVSFRDGTTEVALVALDADGKATFNTSILDPNGVAHDSYSSHSITAVYLGDANFSTMSTASPVTFRIVNPGVVLSAAPASVTLKAGSQTNFNLSVRSIVGYKSKLVLACHVPSELKYTECTFSEAQPSVDPGQSVGVVVTVHTNVPVYSAANSSQPAPWVFASMFGVGLVGLVFAKKTRYNGRSWTIVCVVLLLAAALVGMMACSNGNYTKTPEAPRVATPTGTYAVSITATESSQTSPGITSQPFTFQVTVQ